MTTKIVPSKKTTALTAAPSEEQLAMLKSEFPTEQGFTRKFYPRLGMISQDVTEEKKDPKTGKKKIELVTEAGTFFTEKQDPDEKDEKGNPVWNRLEIGNEIEATIVFQRKQLKYYNQGTQEFTSSPIFDDENDIVPLFLNKQEIARGTPKELMAREEYLEVKDGKTKSKLEYNRVLYVLMDGEIFQMNLRGSSMYSFMTYARKNTPPASLTKMNSEAKENGAIKWNQMTFETVRDLTGSEVDEVLGRIADLKQDIVEEKSFFANKAVDPEVEAANKKAQEDFDKM